MKKLIAVLCVVVLAAAVGLCVTIAGKNDTQSRLEFAQLSAAQLTEQLNAAQRQAGEQTAALQADLDASRAETALAQRAAEAAEEQMAALSAQLKQAEEAAAEAAKELAEYKQQAEEALGQARAEAEAFKAAAEEAARQREEAAKTVPQAPAAQAGILFFSADYTVNTADGQTFVKTADITGPGEYTVSAGFPEPARGAALAALVVDNGETLFPGMVLRLRDVRVNGEEAPFSKGYTFSLDGTETRMTLYQDWAEPLPENARTYDGDPADAFGTVVAGEALSTVHTLEITFEIILAE